MSDPTARDAAGTGPARTDAAACADRRPYLGRVDPIRIARDVLIVCTKEAGHQGPHYDVACDVSWPNARDGLAEPSDNHDAPEGCYCNATSAPPCSWCTTPDEAVLDGVR